MSVEEMPVDVAILGGGPGGYVAALTRPGWVRVWCSWSRAKSAAPA